MSHLKTLAISLVLAVVAVGFVTCSSDEIQSNIAVSVVPDVEEFLIENPDLEIVPLIKDIKLDDVSPYFTLTYTLGSRVSGDRLVGTGSASQRWGTAQNVRASLSYPANGVGAIVTYMEIIVIQSTNLGRAYVVAGGLGRRQISVVVEAQATLYFEYRASVFGY